MTNKPVPVYGTIEWRIHQYERMKEENRGHNYRYWNEKWWKEQEAKGWKIVPIPVDKGKFDYWTYEEHAKEIVDTFRKTGYYSRIICGYHKTKQRQKFYTVIYKQKK